MVKVKVPWGAAGEDASLGDIVDKRGGYQVPAANQEMVVNRPEAPPDPVGLARDIYEDSTRFVESSLKAQWEKDERAFQGRHPPGSKYLSDSFKGRTSLYRPKTRTMIRQGDANLAQSFFSNEDVLVVRPYDETNELQAAAAEIHKELLQYRLTTPNPRVGIPWFLITLGAYQDAQKYGCVASKQYWEYKEREDIVDVPVTDPATGQPVIGQDGMPAMRQTTKRTVIRDKPVVDLIPIENLRIDRSAHWYDPINTSPFVIILTPMYIHEIERRMETVDPKTGQPQWLRLQRAELKQSATRQAWDSTRLQREGHREDSKDSEITVDEYSIVWVHENIVQWNDRDWVYYTSGINHLLSHPKPLEEVYRHATDGNRPIVMGYCLLEAHKIYPSSKVKITESLQREANDVVNLRLDNVKLALNKRYLVRRGRQVDLRSLLRNVAGSITLVTDLEGDVKVLETKDVTSSAYQEQNLLNVDFDDIAGMFTPGTVATNRRLNETVGGLQLLSGASNLLSEMDLRVFTETWAEPVLRQLIQMERHYETDTVLLATAGEKAKIFQRYGISKINDELLAQDLMVKVNVGLGATDPMQRLNKIRVAAETVGAIFGDKMNSMLKADEILKEIFAPLGFRDGSRFFDFKGQDPTVLMLQQELEQLKKQLETKMIEGQTKKEVAQISAIAKILTQYAENEGKLEREGISFINEMKLEGAEFEGDKQIEALKLRGAAEQGEIAERGRQHSESKKNIMALLGEALRGTNAMELERLRGRNAARRPANSG